jgi:hypothetical protein
MGWRTRLVLAIALAALAASPAVAGEGGLMNAGDAVPGHPGLTYEALVRQALPDLALNSDDHQVEGHLAKAPRHLAGGEFEGDPSDPAVLGFIQDKRILVGGRKRMVLLADLGAKEGRVEGLALLMLFDDESKRPKLLDAADVGLDKDTGFPERQAVLPLGPGDAALVTYSEHDDADLTMGAYMIVSPIGDRLAMVGRFALTSEKLCSWNAIEAASFATAPDPGQLYRRIAATVKAAVTHTGADGCNDEKHPAAATHAFSGSWSWNAAKRRFEPAASTLGGLVALNKKLLD